MRPWQRLIVRLVCKIICNRGRLKRIYKIRDKQAETINKQHAVKVGWRLRILWRKRWAIKKLPVRRSLWDAKQFCTQLLYERRQKCQRRVSSTTTIIGAIRDDWTLLPAEDKLNKLKPLEIQRLHVRHQVGNLVNVLSPSCRQKLIYHQELPIHSQQLL